MNIKYYYRRDRLANAPVITICLVEENGIVARGIAICSMVETPCKSEGREMAKKRALAAFDSKNTSMPIVRWEAEYVLYDFDDASPAPNYKSEYRPLLTEFEQKILWKK